MLSQARPQLSLVQRFECSTPSLGRLARGDLGGLARSEARPEISLKKKSRGRLGATLSIGGQEEGRKDPTTCLQQVIEIEEKASKAKIEDWLALAKKLVDLHRCAFPDHNSFLEEIQKEVEENQMTWGVDPDERKTINHLGQIEISIWTGPRFQRRIRSQRTS